MVLLAVLLTAAPASCEHPALSSLDEAQQEAACRFLALPEPSRADTTSLTAIYERPGFERARQRSTGALQAFFAQLRAWFEKLFESSGAETYSNVTRIIVLGLALAIGATVVIRVVLRRREKAIPDRFNTRRVRCNSMIHRCISVALRS